MGGEDKMRGRDHGFRKKNEIGKNGTEERKYERERKKSKRKKKRLIGRRGK